MNNDPFGTLSEFDTSQGRFKYYRLEALSDQGLPSVAQLPFSLRILLEAVLRQVNGREITEEHVRELARWRPNNPHPPEVPFLPARVIMQDFTGVPALVDLAAMRSALQRLGGDPAKISPRVPVDLVIDHSVQVDFFASPEALGRNAEIEFKRNRERYEFLRWGAEAFANFRVVPPATGIVHQVNLEYLASVAATQETELGTLVFPDTLVGTDS
ncbi:MAG: aconitase family protein, partial [Anaerolineales bacterium]